MSNPRSATRTRISSATGAATARSPLGVVGAVSLHVLIAASALFTWSHRADLTENIDVVPIELVTLGAKTNVTPTVKELPKPQDVEEPKQEEAQPEEKPDTPEPVPSEPVIAKKAPPPLPTPRTPEKKKPAADPLAALLDKALSAPKAPANAKLASRTTKGIGDMNAMSADLRSFLVSQIFKCWNPPAAAPHPEQLIVDMRIFLNPDGSVARAPQLTADSSDPFQRAAAESAKRAIYVCAPYKLPADRYAEWHEFTVTFDPRALAGIQ